MIKQSPLPSELAPLFPVSDVLMIRPSQFELNNQTSESNAFIGMDVEEAQKKALEEFDDVVTTLREYGVQVVLINDSEAPHTPDAVFPTWVTFHYQHKGSALLYPMMAENRRLERRRDVLSHLSSKYDFHFENIYDLSPLESDGEFLEGMGSLVLDRINHTAYANLSPRTTLEAIGRFSQYLDYKVIILQACDSSGAPIYHTNLLMSVCKDFAVICDEAISNSQSRNMVLDRLKETEREIISISREQMHNFAGNIIQLRNKDGEKFVIMSERAYMSLRADQIKIFANYGKVVSVSIPTIENVAGALINPICLPQKKTARSPRKIAKPRAKAKTPSL